MQILPSKKKRGKSVDELLMERYALAKERVSEIVEEKAVQTPYLGFFQKTAAFLKKNTEILDGETFAEKEKTKKESICASDLSLEQWKHLNQDLYADMWMYNIVSLKIMEANEKKHLTQNDDGEYAVKRNFNKTLGTMKRYFLKMLMCEDEAERQKLQEKIWMNINGAICWVKKGERQFSRKQSVNKSSISYRKSY